MATVDSPQETCDTFTTFKWAVIQLTSIIDFMAIIFRSSLGGNSNSVGPQLTIRMDVIRWNNSCKDSLKHEMKQPAINNNTQNKFLPLNCSKWFRTQWKQYSIYVDWQYSSTLVLAHSTYGNFCMMKYYQSI